MVLLFGQKNQRNYLWISALKFFVPSLGASRKLFGASCRLPCLWYYILSPQEAQRASRKPPRKLQKKSGQKFRNNFVGILEELLTPKGHFEINWPLEKSAIAHPMFFRKQRIALISPNIWIFTGTAGNIILLAHLNSSSFHRPWFFFSIFLYLFSFNYFVIRL